MFLALAAAALSVSPGVAKADLWMIEASGDTRRIRPAVVALRNPAKPLIRLVPRPKQGAELAAIIARVKRENGIKG